MSENLKAKRRLVFIVELIKNIIIGIVNAYDSPKNKPCHECGCEFPDYYMTEKGICRACHKKNAAYNSMGYPRIQHAKERDVK